MADIRILKAQTNEGPAIIMVDADLDQREASAFPHLVTISMPVRDPSNDGLCSQAESDRLGVVEDVLLDRLPPTAYRFLGHVTSGGLRQIWLYVGEPDVASDKLKASGINLSIAVLADSSWSFRKQFMG